MNRNVGRTCSSYVYQMGSWVSRSWWASMASGVVTNRDGGVRDAAEPSWVGANVVVGASAAADHLDACSPSLASAHEPAHGASVMLV